MIKVLVVEDSPVAREFLIHLLNSAPGIQVVGAVDDGREALEAAREKHPDLITMDIHMPEMDGFATTRRIMENHPVPIVIVSGSTSVSEAATVFRAIEAGALAVISRPHGFGHPEHESSVKELIQTVRLMSEIKVVRRWPRQVKEAVAANSDFSIQPVLPEIEITAIGASTGGPLALQTILSSLPKSYPIPIVIVQHIARGFTEGFGRWLDQSSDITVRIASDGEPLHPGNAYLAPEGYHMITFNRDRLALVDDPPRNGLRPSVSHLFESVARVFGENSVGILLTGMGRDGARELKLMRDSGAVTIAQDKDSSIIHGMPGEAISLGAATYVLPPKRIAKLLTSLPRKKR